MTKKRTSTATPTEGGSGHAAEQSLEKKPALHVTHWQRALVYAQFGMGRAVAALPQSSAVWSAAQVSVLGLQTWSVAHVVAPPLSHEQLEVLLPPSVLETQNEPRLHSVLSQ